MSADQFLYAPQVGLFLSVLGLGLLAGLAVMAIMIEERLADLACRCATITGSVSTIASFVNEDEDDWRSETGNLAPAGVSIVPGSMVTLSVTVDPPAAASDG